MISNKRIVLILPMAVAMIAAIAVVPGHPPLVKTVKAQPTIPVIILRCAAAPNQSLTVYSFDQSVPVIAPIQAGSDCAKAIAAVLETEILGTFFVREDYGEALAAKVTGDLQISTWVFTGPAYYP